MARVVPSLVVVAVFVCFSSVGASCFKCPPRGFDAVKDFRPEEFIKHSWYSQEQSVVAYQWLNTFYCTVATYEAKQPDDISKGLTVYNYANIDKVNGEAIGTSGSGGSSSRWLSNLEAIIPDKSQPSKLLVGLSAVGRVVPGPFLRALYGPYWVVAVGEDSDGNYKWAIISAGAPEVKGTDGCKTGSDLSSPFLINGVGLWLFSRKPVDPAATKEMRSVAKDLGFDISVLYPVKNEGCEFKGAILK